MLFVFFSSNIQPIYLWSTLIALEAGIIFVYLFKVYEEKIVRLMNLLTEILILLVEIYILTCLIYHEWSDEKKYSQTMIFSYLYIAYICTISLISITCTLAKIAVFICRKVKKHRQSKKAAPKIKYIQTDSNMETKNIKNLSVFNPSSVNTSVSNSPVYKRKP